MPAAEAEQLRAALRVAVAATQARVAALQRELDEIIESGSLTNTDDEHDPDGTTIAYERARTTALLHRARQDLDELASAEGRLDAGRFGLCLRCGRFIGVERLLALPTTEHCVGCAASG